jgi:hypothetical protein
MEKGIWATSLAVIISWIIHFLRIRRATPDDKAAKVINQSLVGQLPKYCTTAGGEKIEPINLILLADETDITASFRAAGWLVADRHSPRTTFKGFWAMVFNIPYPRGPFTPLFVEGKPQAFSYEKPHPHRSFRYRHHMRIWPSTHLVGQRRIWVAAASNEIGLRLTARPMFVFHRLDPDLDAERDTIAADLLAVGASSIGSFQVTAGGDYATAFAEPYRTDGQAVAMELPRAA